MTPEKSIEALFADTDNFVARYKAILAEFDIDPKMIASLTAIVFGMLKPSNRKSMETTAYEISRILLALLIWLEFGPRKAAALVPILSEIFKNGDAVFFGGYVDSIPAAGVQVEANFKFDIRDDNDQINIPELRRYMHTTCIDVMQRSQVPWPDVMAVMVATIRHMASAHIPDRNDAVKALALASKTLAEGADAFAEATSCQPETGRPPLAN